MNRLKILYLRVPSIDGLVGIKAKHTHAIIALDIGELKIICEGRNSFLATSGGYVEITNNKVQILAETIEHSDEIDADVFNPGRPKSDSPCEEVPAECARDLSGVVEKEGGILNEPRDIC